MKIVCEFIENKGKEVVITVMNHAPENNVIDKRELCAAVSCLVYTLKNTCTNLIPGDGEVIREGPGHFCMSVKTNGITENETIVATIYIGLAQLSNQFPDLISCDQYTV